MKKTFKLNKTVVLKMYFIIKSFKFLFYPEEKGQIEKQSKLGYLDKVVYRSRGK